MQNFNTSEKQNIKVTDQVNRLLEFQEGTLQLHVINNDGTDTVTPITSYTLNNGTLEITNLTIPGRAENRPDAPVQAYVEFNVKVLGQTGLTIDSNAWTIPNQATISMDGMETVTPNTNVYAVSYTHLDVYKRQVTNYMYAFINRSEYDRIYTNVNWSSNPSYGNRGAANDTDDLDRNPDNDYYIYSRIYTYLYPVSYTHLNKSGPIRISWARVQSIKISIQIDR